MPAEHTAPTRRAIFPTERAHPPGKLELQILDGPDARTLELDQPLVTVGRSKHADLRVKERSVSAVHFELRAREGSVEVRDLDSTNGLWFGGRRVSTLVLEAGDEFSAGSCRFKLVGVATRAVELVAVEKFGRLYGSSLSMRELYTEIDKAGPAPLSVLLLGETGTGKELTAQTLHSLSDQRGGPLVVLDCSTLTPSLAEAALFGVRKGSYTGAERDQVGVFEAADGGTLFIDELGELSPAMQAKLLRVLEDGQIKRVGESTASAKVDFRVIAATNQDLRAAVEDGRFREELFYRLSGAVIHLPPLRERGDDIMLLAQVFLAEVARDRGHAIELDDKAKAALEQYKWPGNVRELRNAVRRAGYFQTGGVITRADLRLGDRRLGQSNHVERMIRAGASRDEIHANIDAMFRPTCSSSTETSRASPMPWVRAGARSASSCSARGCTSICDRPPGTQRLPLEPAVATPALPSACRGSARASSRSSCARRCVSIHPS